MNRTLAFAIALGLAACYPSQASASTADFSFSGGGVNAFIELTYGTATDAKYSQAFEVTGISGTFSDATSASPMPRSSG